MDTDRNLAEKYMQMYPQRAAQIMESLTPEELAGLLSETPVKVLGPVLNTINSQRLARSISSLPPALAGELVGKMDPINAQNTLRHLEPPDQRSILNILKPALASALKRNLEQASGTVGAAMLPVGVVLQLSMTIKEALDYLKKYREEPMNPLLVTNEKGELMGEIPLKSLLLGERTEILANLVIQGLPALTADTSLTVVQDHEAWRFYPMLPVTDRSNLLVGVLPAEIALKADSKRQLLNREILETTTALGELYRIGLAGFLQSVNRRN